MYSQYLVGVWPSDDYRDRRFVVMAEESDTEFIDRCIYRFIDSQTMYLETWFLETFIRVLADFLTISYSDNQSEICYFTWKILNDHKCHKRYPTQNAPFLSRVGTLKTLVTKSLKLVFCLRRSNENVMIQFPTYCWLKEVSKSVYSIWFVLFVLFYLNSLYNFLLNINIFVSLFIFVIFVS